MCRSLSLCLCVVEFSISIILFQVWNFFREIVAPPNTNICLLCLPIARNQTTMKKRVKNFHLRCVCIFLSFCVPWRLPAITWLDNKSHSSLNFNNYKLWNRLAWYNTTTHQIAVERCKQLLDQKLHKFWIVLELVVFHHALFLVVHCQIYAL